MNSDENKRITHIVRSIDAQYELEKKNRHRVRSIARFDVTMDCSNGESVNQLWLTNDNAAVANSNNGCIIGSKFVAKNSTLGRILTEKNFGIHKYKAPKYISSKYLVEREVMFDSKTTFSNTAYEVADVRIELDGGLVQRFASLDDIIKKIKALDEEIKERQIQLREEEERRKAEELAERQREEKRIAELAAAKEEAEKRRIEEERRKAEALAEQKRREAEEAERKKKEEIERLEKEIEELNRSREDNYVAIRKGYAMRVQDVIDMEQTKVKFSHLYDGIPIVIEGGPGTGKTTTSIQRQG